MDFLIAPNSVPLSSADIAPTQGTPQYATSGNVAAGIPPTTNPAYMLNVLMTEIITVIEAAGLTRDGANWTQLNQAIAKLIQEGSAAGTYLPLSGGAMSGPMTVEQAETATAQPIPIDQADGRYLNLTGGAMDGSLEVQPAKNINDAVPYYQTWGGYDAALTNQTDTNTLGTVYTNTEDVPRTVCVCVTSTVANTALSLFIGDNQTCNDGATIAGQGMFIFGVVPPLASYKVVANQAVTLTSWTEY